MKIWDKVKILEMYANNCRYAEYEVIKIYRKRFYNMCLCENMITKVKTTFTDLDLKEKYRNFKKVEVL